MLRKLVMIFCFILAVVLALQSVEGYNSKDIVNVISNFDSRTRNLVTDDTGTYYSPDSSIKLDGGRGTLEHEGFSAVRIEFYGYIDTIDKGYVVEIGNVDSSESNSVEITISGSGTGRMDLGVKDRFLGKTGSTGKSNVDIRVLDRWVKVEINIIETLSDTDGTARKLEVVVSNQTIIDGFALLDAELDRTIDERSYDYVYWESDPNAEVFLDEIVVLYFQSGASGMSLTALFGIGVILIAFIYVASRNKKPDSLKSRPRSISDGKK
ncbi:MAG: hypothetical protein KAR42_17355 [candidate division Zixibacteria bacterium]|nr:hypothetical protein [candidate division Zixibacteria bacterium]